MSTFSIESGMCCPEGGQPFGVKGHPGTGGRPVVEIKLDDSKVVEGARGTICWHVCLSWPGLKAGDKLVFENRKGRILLEVTESEHFGGSDFTPIRIANTHNYHP